METVATEGEIAGDELAGIVSGEGTVELDGVTGEFGGGFQGEAVGAGDFEAELSRVALRADRKGEEENS